MDTFPQESRAKKSRIERIETKTAISGEHQALKGDDLVSLIQSGKIGVSHAELTSPFDLRFFR